MVAGNTKLADGLQTYLLSRDHVKLKSEFQQGNGKVCFTSRANCAVLLFANCVCFACRRKIAWVTHSMYLLVYADNSWLHRKCACCGFGFEEAFVFDCWGLLLSQLQFFIIPCLSIIIIVLKMRAKANRTSFFLVWL